MISLRPTEKPSSKSKRCAVIAPLLFKETTAHFIRTCSNPDIYVRPPKCLTKSQCSHKENSTVSIWFLNAYKSRAKQSARCSQTNTERRETHRPVQTPIHHDLLPPPLSHLPRNPKINQTNNTFNEFRR